MSNQSLLELEAGFKDKALSYLETTIKTPYPGYPTTRLILPEPRVDLPYGPWELDPGKYPTPEETEEFLSQGLKVDSNGRPLHPWLDDMVTNPNIGVVTGLGFYWNFGFQKNETVDPVVFRYDLGDIYTAIIRRSDTGDWALAGGFHDKFIKPELGRIETYEEAVLRELLEETQVDASEFLPRQFYSGPVSDKRATANAWPYTRGYRIDLPNRFAKDLPVGPYRGSDESPEVLWVPVADAHAKLLGSHSILLAMALTLKK